MHNTTRRLLHALTVATALVLVAHTSEAQTRSSDRDSSFLWTARMTPGASLRVYSTNGPITAVLATDATAEVKGVKRGRYRGDDDDDDRRYRSSDIVFETKKFGNDYVICAMDPEDECEEDGISNRNRSRHNRYMRAEMTVRVPKGVKFFVTSGNGEVEAVGTGAGVFARSGNGAVTVEAHGDSVSASSGNGNVEVLGAGGPVDAHSGNGRIEVVTSMGPVQATTGNGNIDVEMTEIRGSENMSFRSGNGRVSVTLPADFNGELESSTGNGHLVSDFALSVEGRLDRQRVRATIGKGGPRLKLSSGNGNLVLRKAGSSTRRR